jgi:sugar phosphate isomerase/epimerase
VSSHASPFHPTGAKHFIEALRGVGYTGPLRIEREAGNQRLIDVQAAVETLRSAAV